MKFSNAHQRYLRQHAAPDPSTGLTVTQAIARAAERLYMPVLVDGVPSERAVMRKCDSTGRRVPKLEAGETLRFGIDGTTHITTGGEA